MSGLFLFDSIRSRFRRRNLEKKLRLAHGWPIAIGEVNHWAVVDADEDAMSTATPYQIEASFHFLVGGEYFGGYFRSVGLVRREAEAMAKGSPNVNVRYDPANPDSVVVLAEDNADNLPFRIFSYPQNS
ncbi:MAG TPA: DUF3592 domain-containing protein [Edaphobacter sp.]|nr:DUF3592 domain-containing protein [Edaphobacter sp.]